MAKITLGSRVKVFDPRLFIDDITTPPFVTILPATVVKKYSYIGVDGKYRGEVIDVKFDHRPDEISKCHFVEFIRVANDIKVGIDMGNKRAVKPGDTIIITNGYYIGEKFVAMPCPNAWKGYALFKEHVWIERDDKFLCFEQNEVSIVNCKQSLEINKMEKKETSPIAVTYSDLIEAYYKLSDRWAVYISIADNTDSAYRDKIKAEASAFLSEDHLHTLMSCGDIILSFNDRDDAYRCFSQILSVDNNNEIFGLYTFVSGPDGIEDENT